MQWFNPLVWLAFHFFCKDIELACDERVVSDYSLEKRKEYSYALVNCSSQKKAFNYLPLGFGESSVKERVVNVLSYKKPAFWVIILCVFAAAGIGFFSLTYHAAWDYGYKHVTDPEKYQRTVGSYTIEYFPEDISAYTVNDYSYTSYDSLDTCTEVFLDISVSEEQFDNLILLAEQYSSDSVSKTAYYNTDYTEIVYVNRYDDYNDGESKEKKVGKADIKKVIYNKDTNNIVYVYFKAYDTGVYPVEEVAYYNRFGIDEAEYAIRSESNYER